MFSEPFVVCDFGGQRSHCGLFVPDHYYSSKLLHISAMRFLQSARLGVLPREELPLCDQR